MDASPRPPWAFSVILSRVLTLASSFHGSGKGALASHRAVILPETASVRAFAAPSGRPSPSPPRPPAVSSRAWTDTRNQEHGQVDWQFRTDNARIKLKHLYPQFVTS